MLTSIFFYYVNIYHFNKKNYLNLQYYQMNGKTHIYDGTPPQKR